MKARRMRRVREDIGEDQYRVWPDLYYLHVLRTVGSTIDSAFVLEQRSIDIDPDERLDPTFELVKGKDLLHFLMHPIRVSR